VRIVVTSAMRMVESQWGMTAILANHSPSQPHLGAGGAGVSSAHYGPRQPTWRRRPISTITPRRNPALVYSAGRPKALSQRLMNSDIEVVIANTAAGNTEPCPKVDNAGTARLHSAIHIAKTRLWYARRGSADKLADWSPYISEIERNARMRAEIIEYRGLC
jgi:hypothetical protein